MPQVLLQFSRRLAGRLALQLWGWVAPLLLLSIPGAVLVCILHCMLPAYPASATGHAASPFLCNHVIESPGGLPPVSATVVQALIQGLAGPVAPVAIVLTLLHLTCTVVALPRARFADGPPVPPPRHSVA